MTKPMFDADALISMFQGATARQGSQLQKAASDATLAALQGRELSLKNIRGALKQVATPALAASATCLSAPRMFFSDNSWPCSAARVASLAAF